MAATLTITVTDTLMERIREDANRQGMTPEDIAGVKLASNYPMSAGEFIRTWSGAFQSGVPDLCENMDEYLGKAYLDPHDDEDPK